MSEIKTASDFLKHAQKEMDLRGVTYDSRETGERSMSKTVALFNVLHGTQITETQGWEFMQLLKMVRANQGAYKADNYVDGAAYASLAGESKRKVDIAKRQSNSQGNTVGRAIEEGEK